MSGPCSTPSASAPRLVRYGGDCYAYAQLAMGHVDVVIDTKLQPYDIVAPMAIIEAAGGVVIGGAGRPASDGGFVATGSADLAAQIGDLFGHCDERSPR